MKLKIVMAFSFLLLLQMSYAQDIKTVKKPLKTKNAKVNDTKDFDTTSNIQDYSKLSSLEKESNTKTSKTYTDKKWKKIERQIKRNKKRISQQKQEIKASKIIDTIFLDIPKFTNDTRLSDW
ncbi:hypothetical protein [Aquimarina sp. 2201CG5-10]|uniref:hypothetical protein n=1 Tax=Aquimarina callyspongiae TaxID=3098150 RepID=UPI002AB5AA9D|nr:hypothetical protein [Aquimarina sp. 2201CG5-10]MDY8136535.1 hypothetical protein [Aquimarina sp. 2201CG5-10]